MSYIALAPLFTHLVTGQALQNCGTAQYDPTQVHFARFPPKTETDLENSTPVSTTLPPAPSSMEMNITHVVTPASLRPNTRTSG